MSWYIGFKHDDDYVTIFEHSGLVTKKEFGHLYTNVGGPFNTRQTAIRYAKKDSYKIKRRVKKNPPQKITEIYGNITAIEATKGTNSLWPKEKFRHAFKKGGKIYGLDDGSLLVKPKKNNILWKNFKY